MKKFVFPLIMVVFTLTVYSESKDKSSISNETDRDIYYSATNDISRVNPLCLQTCLLDDCEGEGAICAPCSYGSCNTQSMCTCLDYGAPYVNQVATCIGTQELTPSIWAGMSDSERNSECVVSAIEPHLIPDPDRDN